MRDKNLVELSGIITLDPECSKTQRGADMVMLTLSVIEHSDYQNKDIEKVFQVYFFGKLSLEAKILKKGQKILILGKLNSQSYEQRTSSRTKYNISVAPIKIEVLSDAVEKDMSRDFEEVISPEEDIIPF